MNAVTFLPLWAAITVLGVFAAVHADRRADEWFARRDDRRTARRVAARDAAWRARGQR